MEGQDRGWLNAALYGGIGIRSGWRALAWMNAITAVSVPFFGLIALVLWLVQPELSLLLALSFNGLSAAPTWLGTWATVRGVDGATLESVGLGGRPLWALGQGVLGAGIGVGMVGAVVAPLWALGQASISWRGSDPWMWCVWALVLLFAAAWEELLFRGYAFQWIARGIGQGWATGLFAVAFGALHLTNPNITGIGLLNITLASVVLSVALFTSRSLWLPIGLHWGWNMAQAIVLGVPVSGLSSEEVPSLWATELSGPAWLSGEAFGFEGSVVGIASLGLGGAACWVAGRAQRARAKTKER